MEFLTVSSALISPTSDKPLTPAMVTVIWVIGDELDRRRIPSSVENSVWLTIPSQRLRPKDGKDDNQWLRVCLDRLLGLKLAGEYRGDPWGAVLVAEYRIEKGGTLTRLLIPPAAIQAIRAPETFGKIEYDAAWTLKGPARRLYSALADKKRMGNPYWIYHLDELHKLLDVSGQYKRWADFRRYVLEPIIKEINDYGTVNIKMTQQKTSRAVTGVRFDWVWKTLDEARETKEKNDHHSTGRNKTKEHDDTSPLSETIDIEEAISKAQQKERDEQARKLEHSRQVAADKAAFRAWLVDNPGGNMSAYVKEKKEAAG